METQPKSPQELTAQAISGRAYFVGYEIGEPEAERLNQNSKQMIDSLEASNPYMQTDETLQTDIDQRLETAIDTGIWDPKQGHGAEERLTFSYNRLAGFHSDLAEKTGEERAIAERDISLDALREVSQQGMVDAIRRSRREQERNFKDPTSKFIEANPLEATTEKELVASYLERTVDINTQTEAEAAMLAKAFPSGNFLFHSTKTEQILKMMESGSLANSKALRKREKALAKAEGRDTNLIARNSGYEGISWSMNDIDAMPGDRYHMAGFVVAPEIAISDGDQLAVPSRPAPSEVIQIAGAIESSEFYDAKTQYELYRGFSAMGESNSVAGNLIGLNMWNTRDTEKEYMFGEPTLLRASRGVLAREDVADVLRSHYSITENDTLHINPDLVQQVDNEIPIAAVWLQAVIDNGRIENAESFKGSKSVAEVIAKVDDESVKELYRLMRSDWKKSEQLLEKADKQTGAIEVPVEKMYLVAARKDADQWLKVIARMPNKPAGILLYDDKNVRLENFANKHRGDHGALTDELRKAIKPGEATIDYTDVLGAKFEDSMRAGHVHQVIAEGQLGKRRPIKLVDGKLTIL